MKQELRRYTCCQLLYDIIMRCFEICFVFGVVLVVCDAKVLYGTHGYRHRSIMFPGRAKGNFVCKHLNFCQNGGKCVSLRWPIGHWKCACPKGWSGKHCQKKQCSPKEPTHTTAVTPPTTTTVATPTTTTLAPPTTTTVSEHTSTVTEPTESTLGPEFIAVVMLGFVRNGSPRLFVTTQNPGIVNVTTSENLPNDTKSQVDQEMQVNSSLHLDLPSDFQLGFSTGFTKSDKVVSIRSMERISVAVSGKQTSGATDITGVLPLETDFTKYIVSSPNPETFVNHPAFNNSRQDNFLSLFAIAAAHNDTVISLLVNDPATLRFFADNSKMNYTNNTFEIVLHRLQAVNILDHLDVSGIIIQSSKPVAVFSSLIGFFQNRVLYLMEQIPPLSKLDVTYIVPGNYKKPETVIKVISAENTVCKIAWKNETKTISLLAGVPHEMEVLNGDPAFIQSEAPILVTSMAHRSLNLSDGDAHYTVVPGMNHYQTKYKIIIPMGWINNYIALMVRRSSIVDLRLNGQPLQNEKTRSIKNIPEDLGFSHILSVIVVEVEEGELTIESNGNAPFGLMVYGSRNGGGYGFAANGFR